MAMSSDETCPLRRLQEAVEHLSGHDDIEESVYLDACNAMKELHPLTKLYKVTYLKFYVARSGDVPEVARRTCTLIMERKDHENVHEAAAAAAVYGVRNWHYVFECGALPHDMSRLSIAEPFEMDGAQVIVQSVEPYLKRVREEEVAGARQ